MKQNLILSPCHKKSVLVRPNTLPQGAVDANTDMGKPGYFGPCPPVGRVHNYVFTLHFLSLQTAKAVS
jgi:phosphatidylethanolamine-binding protein (PEBP) family uncharacterized protein